MDCAATGLFVCPVDFKGLVQVGLGFFELAAIAPEDAELKTDKCLIYTIYYYRIQNTKVVARMSLKNNLKIC